MPPINWQESLADLDASLRRVVSDWLRKIIGNSVEVNELTDELRDIFIQMSYAR